MSDLQPVDDSATCAAQIALQERVGKNWQEAAARNMVPQEAADRRINRAEIDLKRWKQRAQQCLT
jgi:hypothetical protein